MRIYIMDWFKDLCIDIGYELHEGLTWMEVTEDAAPTTPATTWVSTHLNMLKMNPQNLLDISITFLKKSAIFVK